MMRPPSSGGIGSRFSTMKMAFTMIPATPISASGIENIPAASVKLSFTISAQNSAIARLAPGPAAATHSMWRLGLRRLAKFTGTGLAQPKMKPPPTSLESASSTSGTATVPIGSIWRIGFRLTRPCEYAVRSPKYFAA